MPRSLLPLGRWRPSRPVAAVLLVVLLAMLSVAQLANARAPAPRLQPLPALGLPMAGTTVSGLSSGGDMAGQFHVAHAATLSGAAVLAGGPFGCARGSVTTAMFGCSCPANPGALAQLRHWVSGLVCGVLAPGALDSFTDDALAACRGHVDDPAHLARQRVWLFSGGRDAVVAPALVDAVQAFYRCQGVPDAQLAHHRVPAAAHGLPSPGAPVDCGRTASPYLTRCPGEDAPGDLLAWLYGDVPGAALQPPVAPRSAGLRQGDPHQFNPQGCWDFWGYSLPGDAATTGVQCRYAWGEAPQLRAVQSMVAALQRPLP